MQEDQQQKTQKYEDIEEEFSFQNFEKYIINAKQNFKECCMLIRKGDLNDLQIRFNVWQILLKVYEVQDDFNQVKNNIQTLRDKYKDHYQNFKNQNTTKVQKTQVKEVKQPEKKQPFNPLAPPPKAKKQTNTNNVQQVQTVQDDSALKFDIKKDVDRTYQDREFFKQDEIKQVLTNVLYVWSKLNPDISYRQGMNELVASFMVIYYQQALQIEKGKPEDISQELYDNASFMISTQNVEADVFYAFSQLMALGQDQMFVHKEEQKAKPNSKNNTPINVRLAKIQDYFLKLVDIDLFKHLKLMEVQFTTFLLKWVKCIFTREFEMSETFGLWDIIFMDQYLFPNQKLENLTNLNYEVNNLFMIDCLALAMLLIPKYQIMQIHEGNDCMKAYINYPEIESMKQIIQLALEIKQRLVQLEPGEEKQSKKQFKVFQYDNNKNKQDQLQFQDNNNNTKQANNFDELLPKNIKVVQLENQEKQAQQLRQNLKNNSSSDSSSDQKTNKNYNVQVSGSDQNLNNNLKQQQAQFASKQASNKTFQINNKLTAPTQNNQKRSVSPCINNQATQVKKRANLFAEDPEENIEDISQQNQSNGNKIINNRDSNGVKSNSQKTFQTSNQNLQSNQSSSKSTKQDFSFSNQEVEQLLKTIQETERFMNENPESMNQGILQGLISAKFIINTKLENSEQVMQDD